MNFTYEIMVDLAFGEFLMNHTLLIIEMVMHGLVNNENTGLIVQIKK